MTLKLADHLKLPLDVVTQTMAILAKRRAGKSYTMRRLIEQLVKASQQVVLVDPKGDQWGIRSSADGKGPGLPLVILGGERGDAPLEASAGEIVAKLVVEERVSAVLDLSLFRKHEVATFMTGFLENLYRLKAREVYRTPMMLVIDEADAVAPQKPQKGEERMLGAAEDIVRRGGQRGIGCVLVSQRSAVLNKNVLTQAQILVALRTIAPQDLDAMKAWIDVHGTDEERRTLMDSLPSLPVGDAWFWSPGWPTVDGIFQRVHVLPIETFDSGATPKPGERPREPKTVADVDLEALKRQMAAAIERKKSEDPRELQKTIAQLRKELASKPSIAPTKESQKIIEKPVLTEADRALLARVAERVGWVNGAGIPINFDALIADVTKEVSKAFDRKRRELVESLEGKGFKAILEKIATAQQLGWAYHPGPSRGTVPVSRVPSPPRRLGKVPSSNGNGDASVGNSGLRRMLIALAQRPQGLTRGQLGVRARVSAKGGSFDTYLSKARVNGWVDTTGDRIRITDAGLHALGSWEPLPSGRALLEHYISEFGSSGAARMLRAIADAYPNTITRQDLGEASNVAPSGGSFDTYVSKLRTLELVTGKGDSLRASDELFED